jgi:hypothetical protein
LERAGRVIHLRNNPHREAKQRIATRMDLPPPYTARETPDHSSHPLSVTLVSSPPLFETGLHQNHSEDLEAAVSVSPSPLYDKVNTEGASRSDITTSHSNCEPLKWIQFNRIRDDAALYHQTLLETLRRLRLAGIESTPEWAKENPLRSKERLRAFALFILADDYGLSDMVYLSLEEHRHFIKISAVWFLYFLHRRHDCCNDRMRAPFREVFDTMIFEPAKALGIPFDDLRFLLFRESVNIFGRRRHAERYQERALKSFSQNLPSHYRKKLTWDITTAKALIPTGDDLWPALSTAIRKEASIYFPLERFDPVPVKNGKGLLANLGSKKKGFMARCWGKWVERWK